MKKYIVLLISAAMISLSSCSSSAQNDLSARDDLTEKSETSQDGISEDNAQSKASENDYLSADGNILIAYFSRVGNTDFDEDIDASTSASVVIDGERFGTTEYAANIIQKKIGGDIHLIETETKYTSDFDELTDVNHKEMEEDHLPMLKESDLDISVYDTVFIGFPIWATDAPQTVRSFLTQYDLSGKTVIPFCTHDGYGSGSSYQTISECCPQAGVLDGIAIESKDILSAEGDITEWLSSIGITKTDNAPQNVSEETEITITIGDVTLEGVMYDTPLSKEIGEMFPLTVSMSGFGGREYYGGIDEIPQNTGGGQLYFNDGDITYCAENNTMAIFYSQTDDPDLTMKVIPVGKVTSELSVFDTLEPSVEIKFDYK